MFPGVFVGLYVLRCCHGPGILTCVLGLCRASMHMTVQLARRLQTVPVHAAPMDMASGLFDLLGPLQQRRSNEVL